MPMLNLDLKLQLSVADLLEALLTQSGLADGDLKVEADATSDAAEGETEAESEAAADSLAKNDLWRLGTEFLGTEFLSEEEMNSMKNLSPGLAGSTETPTWMESAPWESYENPPKFWDWFLGKGVGASTLEVPDDGSPTSEEEAWSRRAVARRKQIQIGKSRPEYLRYISEVNKEDRLPTHPTTPSPTLRIPKRQFDRKLSKWRQQLHEFDPPGTPPESSEHQSHAKESRDHPYPLKLFPYLEPQG